MSDINDFLDPNAPGILPDPEGEEEEKEEAQPVEGEGKEAPVDSPPQEAPKEEEPEEEEVKMESLPFHKHPRWLKTVRENEELKQKLDAINQNIASLVESKSQESGRAVSVPQNYQSVFGDDAEAYAAFLNESIRSAEAAALKAVQTERQKETQAATESQRKEQEILQKANEQFEEISEEAGVDLTNPNSKLRQRIIDVLEENDLFSESGMPNIKAAYKFVKALDANKSTEQKTERQKIAATTSSAGSTTASKSSDAYTTRELKTKRLEDFLT